MRLLLAEDERALSRALTTILEKNHYTVDAVYNGEDALEYMKTGNYDAAIFDIMMPVTDGMTALKQLRARGNTTPVIMLTAKAEIEDRVLGLDSGANDPAHRQKTRRLPAIPANQSFHLCSGLPDRVCPDHLFLRPDHPAHIGCL